MFRNSHPEPTSPGILIKSQIMHEFPHRGNIPKNSHREQHFQGSITFRDSYRADMPRNLGVGGGEVAMSRNPRKAPAEEDAK
jgi:hypothetical protein